MLRDRENWTLCVAEQPAWNADKHRSSLPPAERIEPAARVGTDHAHVWPLIYLQSP